MSVRGEGKEKVGPKTWSVFHLTFRHLLVNKSCSPVVDALMANIQLSLENSLDSKVLPADCHVVQCRRLLYFLLQRTIFVVLIFILFFQKIKQRRVEKTIDAPVKRRDSTFPPTKEEEGKKKTLGERRCSFEFQKKKKMDFHFWFDGPRAFIQP